MIIWEQFFFVEDAMVWLIGSAFSGVVITLFLVVRFPDDKFPAFLGGLAITLVLVVFLGLGLSYLTTGLMPDYSSGERVGYATKLSQRGAFFKTYEGQLQVGQGEQVAVQRPFDFSVRDPEVLQKLREAMRSGNKVVLHYREWLLMPARIGESSCEVTSVEVIE